LKNSKGGFWSFHAIAPSRLAVLGDAGRVGGFIANAPPSARTP
jgi:hypothetical protein